MRRRAHHIFKEFFCGYSFPFVGVGIELLELLGLSMYV
jgi:hypothetical protein